ncbi:MAG: 2Fe-2S iron-sulfur cluster-binding protein [Flavobacteriia bacterium]|jgi:ring-1,2-phenylacetyl-CoA epoxidase subunit PaaE
MGLFNKIFKKEEKPEVTSVHHKGYHQITIKNIDKVTADTVKISFDIPAELTSKYKFIPGQYVNLCIKLNGNEERRSYSICSGENEDLAIAVKAVKDGKVSKWANEILQAGEKIEVSEPEGNFKLNDSDKTIVAFAAGSGITPILAIAKKIENIGGKMSLFYGNRTESSIIFKSELSQLSNTHTRHFLSQETKDGFENGRVTKEKISEIVKENLDLLKADGFFLCGPEELILNAKEVLSLFGVPKEKIHFELFTVPVLMKSNETPVSNFSGKSSVTVIIDEEKVDFELDAKGKSILDHVTNKGYDAPYSCRGGVCCTCKAKVLEGKASMTLNYSLTDQEVADGYILTCQAHPASEKLVITYDV